MNIPLPQYNDSNYEPMGIILPTLEDEIESEGLVLTSTLLDVVVEIQNTIKDPIFNIDKQKALAKKLKKRNKKR